MEVSGFGPEHILVVILSVEEGLEKLLDSWTLIFLLGRTDP